MSWLEEKQKEMIKRWKQDEHELWSHLSDACQLRFKTIRAREDQIKRFMKLADLDVDGMKRLNITQKISGNLWWLDMNGMRITPILENDKILPEPTPEIKIRTGPWDYNHTYLLMDQSILLAEIRRNGFNIMPIIDSSEKESRLASMREMAELVREPKQKPKMKKTIKLSESEIESGVDRVVRAETLILQLPETHNGRNTWLMNYGKGTEAIYKREKAGLRLDSETESASKIEYKAGEQVAVRELNTDGWKICTFKRFDETGNFVDSANRIWANHKPLSQFNTVFSDN